MIRTTKRMWRVAGLLVVALLIAGCMYKVLPLSARYVILDELPPELTPLSRPVILVADDQQHYLYGNPFWMRSELTARFVRTAIRPVGPLVSPRSPGRAVSRGVRRAGAVSAQ